MLCYVMLSVMSQRPRDETSVPREFRQKTPSISENFGANSTLHDPNENRAVSVGRITMFRLSNRAPESPRLPAVHCWFMALHEPPSKPPAKLVPSTPPRWDSPLRLPDPACPCRALSWSLGSMGWPASDPMQVRSLQFLRDATHMPTIVACQ